MCWCSLLKKLKILLIKFRDWLNLYNTTIVALATVVIAIATWKSCNIQNDSAKIQNKATDISDKLSKIEGQNLNHNIAALETEFRPYLAISLLSQKYPLIERGNNNFLKMPFQIINVGKYPAIGIKAEYLGPIQNSLIEPEDKMDHLLSGEGRIYVPEINIGNLIDNSANEFITTVLKVAYQGILKTDENKYCSRMQLVIKRETKDNKLQFTLANSTFKLKCD